MMPSLRYRAWRFLHPDFDIQEGAVGLRLSATGGIEMVQEDAAVRQALLLLLSTMRGERVMRPTYGCDLHRLVFMPNDATTHGLAIHYVRKAIEQWEPRVEILHLDAQADENDPARLEILLEYRVRRTLREVQLTLSLNLEQGGI